MGCHCGPDNKSLREALDVPDGFPASRHRDYIERSVRTAYPHSVVFRNLIDESTCVLYALGLFRDPTYRSIARSFGGTIFAGRDFVEWSLKGHLEEIDGPEPGSLALYFNGKIWRHAGIVSGLGRVTSQWGTFPVYEHDVCELPARYGNEIRYFVRPGPAESLRMFLQYIKAQGVSDADITKVARASIASDF